MNGSKVPSSPSEKDTIRPPSRRIVKAPVARCQAQIAFPHPLSWWRTRQPHSFKKIDVQIARHFLQRSAIIGEPHWHLGAGGDPATAIGVADRVLKRPTNSSVLLDVAMSAVMCVALEGNAVAALLLSDALKRRCETDPACGSLSDSWLTYDVETLSASPILLHRIS